MTKKRVVVTGLATLNPLGKDLESSWENLVAGKSGIGPITRFDASEFSSKIAGEVKDFDPVEYMPVKEARRMDRFVQFAVATGQMVVEHSGLVINDENAGRVAVLLGVGLGGLDTIEVFHTKLMEAGPNKVSPFMIPMLISNMAPGQVSIFTGAKGPNVVFTSACASGTHAIGHAYTEIVMGRCDAAITGGVESTITPMGVSGFTSLKALCSNRNDTPEIASRPFDGERSGFVIGEGSGFLMLESLEHAQARGANIYAEVVGFGSTGDAYHITAPREDADGMARCMKAAIDEAGIAPSDVDVINAHGTSTNLNDKAETLAMKKVFGDHAYKLRISANKSQTGHLLGAAGGMEGVFSCMTLHKGIVPGTANYTSPDPDCDLNYMGSGTEEYQAKYVLSNNFGFGGTNASILFKRFAD
ncbi:beta-ketoacyl-ACP synthase II [Desulfovibrio subterraneus]|jgi:3-oxoacyl-[acyl-carrier-protein] synthase II|uniref:3-oxoacyl-[acyl-carrier-protein] synthase 2 n=1 Tax=Desulfovibrio subterraneus TaxID=2718620 RepID=A0A7J0BI08_9BACT|nr:beta-ketoacyl-ACP synthase II [Desulfovibrio subterraneus]WBF67506.1 beta-ketoacyl-ACP synthase II [Desulfovibrio subterraneus]GFM33339.1 3-oxoacyl-[acyl-carrier-protein] synthase 2 [Desulfovibrio subterraneus]